MTIIIATPLTAPALSNLQANGDVAGVGIELTWDVPGDNISAVEIWHSETNDRTTATLVSTVVGNRYTHYLATLAGANYYWVRSVNLYGKATGPWLPSSPTAGLLALVINPILSPNPYTGSKAGIGTWDSIGDFYFLNWTSLPARATLLINSKLSYSTEVPVSFRLKNISGTVIQTIELTKINELPFWNYLTEAVASTSFNQYYVEWNAPSSVVISNINFNFIQYWFS